MNNNRLGYQPLQRHKRRSTPTSPTSPTFSRRTLDRSSRNLDVSSPVEGSSTTPSNLESPALDLDLPSPTFDFSTFSSDDYGIYQTKTQTNEPPLFSRASEENGRVGTQITKEPTRPKTSGAIGTRGGLANGKREGHFPNGGSPVLPAPTVRQDEYKFNQQDEGQNKYGIRTSSLQYQQSSHIPVQPAERQLLEESSLPRMNLQKKSRLNLLNPMSLLARRRSAQNQKPESSNLSIKPFSVPALPDNFDPSIRGKVVHDFSAPRTRRIASQNEVNHGDNQPQHDTSPLPNSQSAKTDVSNSQRPSTGSTSNQIHSPIFTENFQDDRGNLRPSHTGYLHNIATKTSSADQVSSIVPAFAKRLPSTLPSHRDRIEESREPLPRDPLDKQQHQKNSASPSSPPSPPPKNTPPSSTDLIPASRLPKHMKSTSSRFSFQLGPQASSAQEKLLEDKHKQHSISNQPTKSAVEGEFDEDNYDDYDLDDDDAWEEKIPGVNADLEEDEPHDQATTQTNRLESGVSDLNKLVQSSHKHVPLQEFHFTPQSMTFSPTNSQHASQSTPRDDDGFAIGIADSRDHSQYGYIDNGPKQVKALPRDPAVLDGLGISTLPDSKNLQPKSMRMPNEAFNDSDLYFDDGEFDSEFIDPEAIAFDENMFDDDSGRIRDIPAENARKLDAANEAAVVEKQKANDRNLDNDIADERSSSVIGSSLDHFHQLSLSSDQPNKTATTGLTEDNLAAYHDALASAANEAAANGKFDRIVSFSQDSDDTSVSQHESSQPGFVSDDSRFSNNFESSAIAEDDGFPFDDEFDDELMIAEANAEALENDDEGFYGQEFGFYARAHGKGTTDLVNGGFFAIRGSNGVKRSHSGKANFQEPSLTPITERSEWSTRNSVASLQIPPMPSSAHSVPSPGIAQLLELDSPGFEDEMTLSALMKLRRGTFGGSSTSINSVGANHSTNSPLGHTPNHGYPIQDYSHARVPSAAHSLSASAGIPESEEEDDDDTMNQPTITQNTPHKLPWEVSLLNPHHRRAVSPTLDSSERRRGAHSRTSSGAESVSYARDAEGRWVLERRRTGEDGGQEIIDREYLTGVHI